MHLRKYLIASATVVLVSGIQVPLQASGPACPAKARRHAAEDLPARIPPGCDMAGRVIADHGPAVVVPDPGQSVSVEDYTSHGPQSLVVRTALDGTVEILNAGSDAGEFDTTSGPGAGAGSADCFDSASELFYQRLTGPMHWYFNRNSTPTYIVSADDTLERIRQGGNNIMNVNNECTFSDVVPGSVNLAYQYTVDWGTNMTSDACASSSSRDGYSVVNFGPLPAVSGGITTYGRACTWTLGSSGGYDNVVESDVRLNANGGEVKFFVTNTIPTSCSNKIDLEGLMTHERGHTYGLAHVAEDSHKWLTMSKYFNGDCQISERSLGLGDKNGLDTLY